MKESMLKDLQILAVDDEQDVLDLIMEEVQDACPDCRIHLALSYQQAVDFLVSWTYDLVILDIMGIRGFDLLEIAAARKLPVVMLTAHALTPEALKKSIEMGARAYLPKEKLGEIVPFLEDVLRYDALPAWRKLFEKMGDFFDHRFGAGWQKKEESFWKDFTERLRIASTSSAKSKKKNPEIINKEEE
jgi:CheY-like chemotaxis protein